MKECPDFKRLATDHNKGQALYANDKHEDPAYSFPVMHEEELPDNEVHHHTGPVQILKVLLFAMVAAIFGVCMGALPDFRRLLKSVFPTLVVLVVVAALTSYAFAAPTPSPSNYVQASSYFNSGSIGDTTQFEWLADPGTNRFVTNDINDFMPGTVIYSPLNVSVGGGTTNSPCSGSVLVFSLDHNITIRCDEVILLPKCAKKLMPAYQFTKKGCTLEFATEVHLFSKDGVPILSGPQVGGLFYFHAKTIQTKKPQPEGKVLNATALFGLPASQDIANAGADFPRRLLEAHWSYGHLKFDKLRKILGLKKGSDPECPICTVAKQKQAALADETKKVRSPRPCHRMHMDIGFTSGSDYVFALYVDDYHRVSYLDVLDSKGQSLEKWCELKHKLENKFMPWKFAVIFTDSEPVRCTSLLAGNSTAILRMKVWSMNLAVATNMVRTE